MQQAADVQVASTASLPAADRFPYWADVVAQTFVPLECDTPVQRDFSGSIRHRQIGRIGIADVRASAQRARRTRGTIARAPSDDLIVVVHVEGRCVVAQRANSALLHPRDGAVVTAQEIYSFDFEGAFRQLVLKVPRILVRNTAVEQGLPVFHLARGPANLLRHLALVTLDEPADVSGSDESAVERVLAELLRCAIAPLAKRDVEATASARYAQAQLFIQQNLADPALKPAAIAAHVALSVRSLTRLFAAHGQTIERTIWIGRLAAARDDLADPRQRDRSITEVAFSRGFNDAAHFSRSFANAYGLTPTQFRARAGR